ncbi:MAG: PfkB family carbohydrate kinase [Candidatus Thorarchaeota archaeon]
MRIQDNYIPSLIFIGHFAIDNIITSSIQSKTALGGSVSYCSYGLRTYTNNVKISIISHVGTLNMKKSMLKIIKNKNINLDGIKYTSIKNTNFLLDYSNRERILTLKSRSPNLEFEDLPIEVIKSPPDLFALVPLCNEISLQYVSRVAASFPNAYIGIDLQGFVRKIDENGKVSIVYDDNIVKNINKIIDEIGDKLILKGSEEDIMALANNQTDLSATMRNFKDFGMDGIFIMTRGEHGSLIYKKECEILQIPAFKPKKVVDETGAGDVYFSIFLYEFLRSDKSWMSIKSSAYKASAAASYLIEKEGLSGSETRKNVLNRVTKREYIKGRGGFEYI